MKLAPMMTMAITTTPPSGIDHQVVLGPHKTWQMTQGSIGLMSKFRHIRSGEIPKARKQ